MLKARDGIAISFVFPTMFLKTFRGGRNISHKLARTRSRARNKLAADSFSLSRLDGKRVFASECRNVGFVRKTLAERGIGKLEAVAKGVARPFKPM